MVAAISIIVLCSTSVAAVPVVEIFSNGNCDACDEYNKKIRHQMSAGQIEVINWVQPNASHSLGRVAHDARLFAHGHGSLQTNTIVIQGTAFSAEEAEEAAESTIDAISASSHLANLETTVTPGDNVLNIATVITALDELPLGITLITVIVETYTPTPSTMAQEQIGSLGRTYAFTHRFDRVQFSSSTVHTNISFEDLEKDQVDVNDLSRYRVIHFLVDEFTGDTLASVSAPLQGSGRLMWLGVAPIGALLLIPLAAIGFSVRGDQRRELGMPRLEVTTNEEGHHLDLIAGSLSGEIQAIHPKGPRSRNLPNFTARESHRIRTWSRRAPPPADLRVTVKVEGLGVWDLTLPENNRGQVDLPSPSHL